MSEPVGIVGFEKLASPPAQPPAGGAGDTGFQRVLDEASAGEAGDPGGAASAVRAYNAVNLLNGKFPPPDSGAGFLFTVVAMNQEAML
ncbi:MAG: hypothetical protein AABZ64_03575 [Nitrospinota bacterium]